MLSILGTQMMGMPQGTKVAEGAHVLPWPNGSVLQAKLVPGEGPPGSALLLIGGYRLRAEVPPNVPMGEVWLQIMGQAMPAQFRLLTQFQAHQVLMEMLRQQALDKSGGGASSSGDAKEDRHAVLSSHGWSAMDRGELSLSLAADSNRVLVGDDGGDGRARGVVERRGDGDHFLLHGRLDLDWLGPVAFALEGGKEEPLRLRLFARDGEAAELLRPDFLAWLRQQESTGVDGELISGLPQQRGMEHDIVV